MNLIRQQIAAGAVVPDYQSNRFIAYRAPEPSPAAEAKQPPVKTVYVLSPTAAASSVEALLNEALQSQLKPVFLKTFVQDATRAALLFAMRRAKGNRVRAAAMLGINRNTLRSWCAKHHVDPLMFGGRVNAKEAA
jgi:DNA-binding NtrC family response regulator